jgi:hypothetical protein
MGKVCARRGPMRGSSSLLIKGTTDSGKCSEIAVVTRTDRVVHSLFSRNQGARHVAKSQRRARRPAGFEGRAMRPIKKRRARDVIPDRGLRRAN